VLTENLIDWLPRQTYPVRHGVHQNSAFGLLRSYDYASWSAKHESAALRDAIDDAAARWFIHDTDYPAHFEPSGTDFLSPALAEAEFMSRTMSPDEFAAWLDAFLPGVAERRPLTLFEPAVVSDLSDGHIAHLAGLNLSRSWSMLVLADRLPVGDARVPSLTDSAARHAAATLHHVVGKDYEVEHWLAGYAVGLLTAPPLP
jgi:hypothetical protein